MACECSYISDLANYIHKNIGEPTSVSVSFIAGKLTSKPFLGNLDSLVFKCHNIVSGCIDPALDGGEQAIYALLYEADYYKKQVNSHIGAAGVKKVLSVSEGDSKISLQNTNESAKIIQNLARDTYKQATEMADLYNRGQATARDVSFYTINPYGDNGIDGQYSPGTYYSRYYCNFRKGIR